MRRHSKDLDKELRAVGLNLKTLEVNEERCLQRENSYNELVRSLQNRVKEVTRLWHAIALSFLFSMLRTRSLSVASVGFVSFVHRR